MLLTVAILALDVLKPADAAGPSFDCTKATAVVPKMICADASLAALDREMAARYAALAEATPPDPNAAGYQSVWLSRRDACSTAANRQACVVEAYQQRITELKIVSGDLPVYARATYLCSGRVPTTVKATYFQSEPPAVLIEYQGAKVVAFAVPSASGSRYATDDVELWEHQGAAAFKWHALQLRCPRK